MVTPAGWFNVVEHFEVGFVNVNLGYGPIASVCCRSASPGDICGILEMKNYTFFFLLLKLADLKKQCRHSWLSAVYNRGEAPERKDAYKGAGLSRSWLSKRDQCQSTITESLELVKATPEDASGFPSHRGRRCATPPRLVEWVTCLPAQ